MIKHFPCYIFLALFAIPVFAIDKHINTQAFQSKNPKTIIDTPPASQLGNNGAADNSKSEIPKQRIQDPNHPMIYCREHTC